MFLAFYQNSDMFNYVEHMVKLSDLKKIIIMGILFRHSLWMYSTLLGTYSYHKTVIM